MANAVGDETERAYRHGSCRKLMDAWANYCEPKGGNVRQGRVVKALLACWLTAIAVLVLLAMPGSNSFEGVGRLRYHRRCRCNCSRPHVKRRSGLRSACMCITVAPAGLAKPQPAGAAHSWWLALRLQSQGEPLMLCFELQLRLVFEAIIPRQPTDQLATLPIVEDATDVFTGNAGHSG